jgi:hypothetical protein
MANMSNLQISLAIAGGVVLAGVVAHSAWSARKNAPKKADNTASELSSQHFPEFVEGAGLALGAGEPLNPDSAGASAVIDKLSSSKDLPVNLYAGGAMAHDKRLGLDALVDVIVPIALETPIYGQAALTAMPTSRRVGSKPFAIEGHNVATRHWEAPLAGQRYGAFQAGVQMANRLGALNEIEFSEFRVTTEAFADAIHGTAVFPEMREAVAHARELDQFANVHDAHLSFSLRAVQSAWSAGYVHQIASRLGFVPGALPGRLVMPSATPGQAPMLILIFDAQAAMAQDPDQTAVRDLALTLEVPYVNRNEHPFACMRDTATALAKAMEGVVTDVDGQPLAESALDQIGAELEGLYDVLDRRDFSAGSPLARRLFS